MHQFRFILFDLSFFTWLFDPGKFIQKIYEGTAGGFRMLRREITWEPRKFLLIFSRPALGLVFQRNKHPEPDYDWAAGVYKTRFFTKTVDTKKLSQLLNDYGTEGYELFFSMKYPSRVMLIFPREAYFFVFRKRKNVDAKPYGYHVQQTPFNFFTKTINPEIYQHELNNCGQSRKLKITYRDERKVFGIFTQPTVVSIWESAPGMANEGGQGGVQTAGLDQLPTATPLLQNPVGSDGNVPNAMAASAMNAGAMNSGVSNSGVSSSGVSSSGNPFASGGLDSGNPYGQFSQEPVPQPTPQPVPAAGKIRIQCTCGKQLAGDASLRGKQIRCPVCQAILKVN